MSCASAGRKPLSGWKIALTVMTFAQYTFQSSASVRAQPRRVKFCTITLWSVSTFHLSFGGFALGPLAPSPPAPFVMEQVGAGRFRFEK